MITKTEIIELDEFYLTGISVRTINNGQAGKDMKALWDRFMNDHVYRQIDDRFLMIFIVFILIMKPIIPVIIPRF